MVRKHLCTEETTNERTSVEKTLMKKQPMREQLLKKPVLWIRIRMDPKLLPGSGIKVPDPDPAKSERAYK